MKFALFVILVAILIFIYFARTGSLKYQVKFYTKRYAQGINSGLSNENVILRLVGFYLQAEPTWKAEYMKGRFNEYFENFDNLIYDIMLFYYKIDPEQQTWIIDKGRAPVPQDFLIKQTDKFLRKYKSKYFNSLDKDNPNQLRR